jgi:phosphate-selective porin OprO and OprP
MTLTRWLVSAAWVSTALVAFPVHAQNAQTEVDALRAEVAALKEQLAAIAAKVDAAEKKPAAVEMKWKGAPETSSGDDGWSFKPRGRLHYDVGYVSVPGDYAVNRNLGFNSRVRRVRLGAEGTMPGGFGYKVEADFSGGNIAFGDTFLSYNPKNAPIAVRIGNFETLNGLEQISSSNNISFTERAAFNDAFLNSRRLGVAVGWHDKDNVLRAEAGLFSAHSIDGSFDNDGWIGAGRLTYSPKAFGGQLHMGASYQRREFASNSNGTASVSTNSPSTNQLARYRARPNTQLTDVRFVDTGSFAAKSDQIMGVELAAIFPGFYFAGEGQWIKVDAYRAGDIVTGLDSFVSGNSAVTPTGDPSFFGIYAEAGYFLTGETRGFKDGVWARTKVSKPLNKKGPGAFQIAVRYEYLDLDSNALKSGLTNTFATGTSSLAALDTRLGRGGTQSSYLLALNWYPIDYIRFMLNYGRVNVEGGPLAATVNPLSAVSVDKRKFSVDILAARMQVEF